MSRLIPDTSADIMVQLCATLESWLNAARQPGIRELTDTIAINPWRFHIRLDGAQISAILDIKTDAIIEDALTIKAAFQMRQRGVETKLVLAVVPTGQDETLIRNIAKVHHWFRHLASGKTFDEIAVGESTST